MAAAANVSLDPTVNPCDDLFGHVCNNWIRNHRIDERTEPWEVRRDRRTMDHKHQAALTSALHMLLAGRAGKRWLPITMRRLYRKCLEPGPNDGAELRSKLLDSAGISPWPHKPGNVTQAGGVSKALGSAYYFTNEPALLSMGVDANGRVYLAEPRLLLDALTVGPAEVAQAAAAVFASAGGTLPPPVDVNRFEGLLDKARRGDDPPPWNTTLHLPEAENNTVPQNASEEAPQGAWASWNLRTIVEEAFESRHELDEVVLRAPSYVDALPDVLKHVKDHELLNYLGLRTALLASRMLPPGPEKQLLCRLLDADDEAPARTAAEHCVRMIGKYEPALALYALATRSPLVNGLDADVLLSFLRRHLSNLVRGGELDTSDESLAARMGDLVDSLPWAGPAPRWMSNATLREAYVTRFYKGSTAPASSQTSQAVFAWMQEKTVHEHLALSEPERTVDSRWAPGLLSTRCRLVPREQDGPVSGDEDALPEATLQVPPAALDLLWGVNPSTAMLQVPRVGVRAFQPVLGHLFRWQLRQLQQNDAAKPSGYNRCSFWRASPDHLDAALETRALSLALRAFLAWPGAPELALPGLQHLEPEQLFFIFYVLNQCESNGPDVQQTLAAMHRQRNDGVRPDRAGWVNRVTAANEDFARAFRCPPPLRSPNPYRDCSVAAAAAGGGRTSRA
ncbi:uncharacterized protein LOC144094722 [Amblyomma americanum]